VESLRLVEIWHEADDPPVRTVSDLLIDALATAARGYVAHEAVPKARRDEEDLHQARVALRRVRSYLRTFRTVVDPVWASSVRAELGWYGGLLGEVRNCDVIEGRITERADKGEDLVGYKELLSAVAAARADALQRLSDAHELPRYQSVLRHINGLANREVRLGVGASEDAAPACRRIMRRPYRAVRDAAKSARRTPTETQLHVLRIRSKELRYASELTAEVFGQPSTRLARAAQRIQDRLGEHRDALATAAFARHAAIEHPAGAYAAGQLVIVERLAAERGLEGLGADLKQLRGRWRDFEQMGAAPKS
jgi:CHAD domain-containing protein